LRSVKFRIEPFVAMPDFGMLFDWVTAFATMFNQYDPDHWWGEQEWEFFLADARKRLTPAGRLFLDLNPTLSSPQGGHERWESCFTPELRAWFLRRGAVIDRSRVMLPASDA
jgi:hypothetical protein